MNKPKTIAKAKIIAMYVLFLKFSPILSKLKFTRNAAEEIINISPVTLKRINAKKTISKIPNKIFAKLFLKVKISPAVQLIPAVVVN